MVSGVMVLERDQDSEVGTMVRHVSMTRWWWQREIEYKVFRSLAQAELHPQVAQPNQAFY